MLIDIPVFQYIRLENCFGCEAYAVVGLVGLMGNDRVRNETFYITGDYTTTCNDFLHEIMNASVLSAW